jgi:hypothetical protein
MIYVAFLKKIYPQLLLSHQSTDSNLQVTTSEVASMAAADKNHPLDDPVDEPGTTEEKQADESGASSHTKAGSESGAEARENIAPHTSHHPRFGDNQVFSNSPDAEELPEVEKAGTYDKIELTEEMCYDELGYSFPVWKKWYVLCKSVPKTSYRQPSR